jgi:hypothetical protein
MPKPRETDYAELAITKLVASWKSLHQSVVAPMHPSGAPVAIERVDRLDLLNHLCRTSMNITWSIPGQNRGRALFVCTDALAEQLSDPNPKPRS